MWGEINTVIDARVYVQNTSGSDKDVLVRRMAVSEQSGSQNYFCWEQCYAPFVSLAPVPLTIPAGATVPDFYADYLPGNAVGKTTIRYSFFDKNNPSDSVWVEVNFNATLTGIAAFNNGKNTISQPMPNPANAFTNFKYNLSNTAQNATLVLYNMLGEKVKELSLEKGTSAVKLHTGTLDAGVYFYSFEVNGEAIKTNRLVVTH